MKIAVWVLRILVGATFIFSGFAKAVDPWGFVYKIDEYLHVWGIDWMSRGVELCAAGLIATVEFASGLLMILGCLRRLSSWTMAAMMCVLLPLTAYIAIASPVEDCGCFGDAWVISNTATLIKNVVLTAMIVFLVINNGKVPGLYQPSVQWVVVTVGVIYCAILVGVGYMVQPMVDFRPYKLGTPLLGDDNHDGALVYEKDGVEQEFSIYELPDSTWTYVRRADVATADDGRLLAIFDGDEDVTEYVVEQEGPQLILLVSNPEYHNRARSSMANRLCEYMEDHEGNMIALLPLQGESLEKWKAMAHPTYEVYSADDTAIKEVARGDAALIYLQDGIIKWKRNLYSLRGDFPDFNSHGYEMDRVQSVDDGSYITRLTIFFLILLAIPLLPTLFRGRYSSAGAPPHTS